MGEISALRKHPCPECGGDAEWNAAKQALACPYCGTVLPWQDAQTPHGERIREHQLEEALRNIPDSERGLKTETRSVKCESCQAISLFEAGRAAQRCDFCGSPAIIPIEGLQAPVTPESLLPTVIPATEVRTRLREWYGKRWFAPNKLKRAALTDTLHGIYLPYWTFDAHAHAEWTAQSGYYYYETVTTRNAQGQMVSQQVRKTRWVPSSGELEHFFDDDLVPGTVGIVPELLRKVEPFPTLKELKPYDPAYVRGWTVERYQVDLRQASETNRQQMEDALHQLCAQQVPGDTHRNLQVEAQYRDRTFKHILVPVWLATYNYGSRSFQVVINGYTGKMAGQHPLSWVKIFFAVVFALIIVALLAYWVGQ